jgi:hypothetical protein
MRIGDETLKLPRRFSIAGLMAIVLMFALSLAALRSQSAACAGGVYLLTYAVILLAIVGAVCRTGSERAWWLGFALFGIVYFQWTWSLGFRMTTLPTTTLPTTMLLDLIRPDGVSPYSDFAAAGGTSLYYWLVGHCLWSLVAATIGGGLALGLFAVPKAESAKLDVEPRQDVRPVRVKWRIAAAVGLALLVPLLALILGGGPLSSPALWASGLYLSTWVLLGIAVLGFACGRGKRRMIWFGAALFGLGYMILNRSGDAFEQGSYVHMVADELLEGLRPRLPEMVGGFPARTAAMAHENARIRRILDRTVPMPFREPTALEDFLKYLRATAKAADGRDLSIYVDPIGLQDADKSMQDTIQIDLENCSIGTALRIALRQLNLTTDVRDGMVYITSYSSDDPPGGIDYYLLVGHCFLAMISAGLGALLVPLVSNRET